MECEVQQIPLESENYNKFMSFKCTFRENACKSLRIISVNTKMQLGLYSNHDKH